MVKHVLFLLLLPVPSTIVAQDSACFRGTGLLRASATISPGFMLHAPITNLYVNGRIEYFTNERTSFRGDSFWYIDAQQQKALLTQNSQFAFGPFYHVGSGRLDLALGFEAGLSLARPADAETPMPMRAQPNVAFCTGLTWTIWDHFHLFADARYVHDRYTGALEGTVPLHEFIVSGGLGFQLRTKK